MIDVVTILDHMTKCPRCNEEKPDTEFWKDNARHNGLQVYCKPCWRGYRKGNPNTKTVARRYYHKTGKYKTAAERYGLTLDEYMRLIKDTCCAICKKEPTRTTKDGHAVLPVVDHDHVTGVVRGVLCLNCNVGLGMFNENIHVIRRAIQYLERKR